ncbi:hypothetical protein [Aeromicrobium sp. UC242_57]|uniref:hypothetical protein n=1 Tax=Aeromicrobium sp. UC242_57 TaxID=3374624 RepID=UPI0037AC1315
MLRFAHRTGAESKLKIIASAQTRDRLPYVEELEAHGALIALTRENQPQPDGTERVAAHIYPDEIAALADGIERAYVCGSVGFVRLRRPVARRGRRAGRHCQGRAVRTYRQLSQRPNSWSNCAGSVVLAPRWKVSSLPVP